MDYRKEIDSALDKISDVRMLALMYGFIGVFCMEAEKMIQAQRQKAENYNDK